VRAGTRSSMSISRAWRVAAGRRDLRDNERRTAPWARMPDLVAFDAASRPEDRNHRGPNRIPGAQRPHREALRVARSRAHSAAARPPCFETTVEGAEISLSSRVTSKPGHVLVSVHAFSSPPPTPGVGIAAGSRPLIAKARRAIEGEGRGRTPCYSRLEAEVGVAWIDGSDRGPGPDAQKRT